MIFYSRNDCPLCEDIEETLNNLAIDYCFVDIDLDESLRKKYNAKIPVLMHNNQELCFPFSTDDILKFAQI